jgi:hypothetical protein
MTTRQTILLLLLLGLLCAVGVRAPGEGGPTLPSELRGPTLPSELQGEWSTSGDDGDGNHWYLTYTIDGHGYGMSGYPPIGERGSLRLLEQQGNRYHLQITDLVAHPYSKEGRALWVTLEDDGETLLWGSHRLR